MLEWVRYRRNARRDHLLKVGGYRTMCDLSTHGMFMPYESPHEEPVMPTCAGCLRALS